ncbi:MAG TPA: phasin family protein [Aquamicrobium sp.]|nr:phasin family protein [Aquamicrobium sp.]
MVQSLEDAGKAGKEFLDAGLKNFASLSKNVQALAVEATEYSRKSFEEGTAALEKLTGARSLEKAVEIQTDYARKAYEGFVAQATRVSELYAEIAKDAYKPFENVVAKAK